MGERSEILDLIFTNEESMVANMHYLPGIGMSDHLCISFDLRCYSMAGETGGGGDREGRSPPIPS